MVGGYRADMLYGGDHEDHLAGRGGHDTVRTGGSWADTVRCGSGHDAAFADRLDAVGRNCESVERPAEG